MRRPHGFPHEVLLIRSADEVALAEAHPATRGLYATDLGYFPQAQGHYRNRPQGSGQHIVLVCLEGQGRVRLADGPFHPLARGDAFLIPEGMAHEYLADEAQPWTLQWVHFRGPLGDALAAAWGDPVPHRLSEPVFARARDHFSDLVALGSRPGALVAFSGALDWWLRLVVTDPPLAPLPGLPVTPGVEEAVRYMTEHLPEPLTVAQLAAQVHLSPSRFAAVFLKMTGSPPLAHFQHLRIQRARTLLERTPLTVAEVAAAVGFQDPLYFSRVFRKATGLSPRAWRSDPRG